MYKIFLVYTIGMFLFNISTYILPSTFILWEVNKVLNIIVIISWNRFQNLFIINHSLLENDIDGDAFCLIKDESLKVMIKSQGLLLKFQKIASGSEGNSDHFL